jgi:hypothetical protein
LEGQLTVSWPFSRSTKEEQSSPCAWLYAVRAQLQKKSGEGGIPMAVPIENIEPKPRVGPQVLRIGSVMLTLEALGGLPLTPRAAAEALAGAFSRLFPGAHCDPGSPDQSAVWREE